MVKMKLGLTWGEISENVGGNEGRVESGFLRLEVNKKMAKKIHRINGEHTTLFIEFCFFYDER